MKVVSWAAALLLGAGLAACATTIPEYRMIPTADHGVGVRFSRGNAAMVSNGSSGSIMLLPVRYNSSSKLFFILAGFNTSERPVNLGPGDPSYAHRRDERVEVAALVRCHQLLGDLDG